MKILITGITGLVGQALTKKLLDNGHEVYGLSRRISSNGKNKNLHMIQWPDTSIPPLSDNLSEIEGVINLMGETIDHRWTKEHKRKIYSSRVESTKMLGKSLPEKLKFFLSASAIGIYQKNRNECISEESAHDQDFLAEVCEKWEQAASEVPATRTLIYRFGVILSNRGGMLKKMIPIYRAGLGGPIGNGKAMMSWIHIDDLSSAILFGINKQELKGVFNLVSPQPVSSLEFARQLSAQLHRPCLMRTPEFILKLVLGEMATIAIDGQMISSQKLEHTGYVFQHPTLKQALADLID